MKSRPWVDYPKVTGVMDSCVGKVIQHDASHSNMARVPRSSEVTTATKEGSGKPPVAAGAWSNVGL